MSLTAASQAKNPASPASVAAVENAVVCLCLINTILLLQMFGVPLPFWNKGDYLSATTESECIGFVVQIYRCADNLRRHDLVKPRTVRPCRRCLGHGWHRASGGRTSART